MMPRAAAALLAVLLSGCSTQTLYDGDKGV